MKCVDKTCAEYLFCLEMIESFRKIEPNLAHLTIKLNKAKTQEIQKFVAALHQLTPWLSTAYSNMQRIHWIVYDLTDFLTCGCTGCNRVFNQPADFRGFNTGYKQFCCKAHANKTTAPIAKQTRYSKNNGAYFQMKHLPRSSKLFRLIMAQIII